MRQRYDFYLLSAAKNHKIVVGKLHVMTLHAGTLH